MFVDLSLRLFLWQLLNVHPCPRRQFPNHNALLPILHRL